MPPDPSRIDFSKLSPLPDTYLPFGAPPLPPGRESALAQFSVNGLAPAPTNTAAGGTRASFGSLAPADDMLAAIPEPARRWPQGVKTGQGVLENLRPEAAEEFDRVFRPFRSNRHRTNERPTC